MTGGGRVVRSVGPLVSCTLILLHRTHITKGYALTMWFDRPAILWEKRNHDNTRESPYWDAFRLPVQSSSTDDIEFLTYRDTFVLIQQTTLILKEKANEVLKDCPAATAVGINIVVAIPEGIYLPLAIACVHRLNPAAVLVPMEPDRDGLRNEMLADARPGIILVAAECDQQKFDAPISILQSSIVESNIYLPACPQVVDFRKIVEQALDNYQPSLRSNPNLKEGHGNESTDSGWRLDLDRHNSISHIVYTSGTTGLPKGCVCSIRSLQNYIRAKNQAHCITESSVILLASALSFDPCLSDILATFTARATLAIAPRSTLRQDLARCLTRLHVTHCLCTPTLWGTLLSSGLTPKNVPCLEIVALGGERIPKQIVRQWARKGKGDTATNKCRLFATYGVTEACVYQTMGEVFQDNADTTNVGHPFPELGIRICREEEQTRLVDVTDKSGEVVLVGNQLDEYSGYWRRPELGHKFVRDETTSRYFYRTGDRGYFDSNLSQLFIQGRIQGEDGMVKFNGVRLELGEIEAALTDSCDDDCVVVDSIAALNENESDDAESSTCKCQLIAYCVLHKSVLDELGVGCCIPNNGVLCSEGPLLALLQRRCMFKSRITPTAFVIVPQIPLSPTGKRNRQGVPKLAKCRLFRSILTSNSFAVADSIPLAQYGKSGSIVAQHLKECLNLQPVQESMLTTSITYAMLGGDSLAATRIVRGLYAYHFNLQNSRELGGPFGSLDGPFAPKHLLTATSLGSYVDFLDSENVCQPRGTCTTQSNHTTFSNNLKHEPSNETMTPIEDLQLYDALFEAISKGYFSVAVCLLNLGADPNLRQHRGRLGKVSGRIEQRQTFRSSPLHMACLKGSSIVVKKLLSKNAKNNSPDASGLFPLHLAATGEVSKAYDEREDIERLECVKALLDFGVPLAMKDGNKQTVLHAAARAGYVHLLRFVLDRWYGEVLAGERHRDSLDWRDRWARTPVHWAILNGRPEALRVLLQAGCSPCPPKPKINKKSSAAVESPTEMCERLYKSTDVNMYNEVMGMLVRYK